jgi:hypothetical protein
MDKKEMNSGDNIHAVRNSALKSCSETGKWRTGFLSKKWLNMNEDVVYKRILRCTNNAFLVDLGRLTKLNVGGLMKLTDL